MIEIQRLHILSLSVLSACLSFGIIHHLSIAYDAVQDQAYISVRETPSAYIFWTVSAYNDFMDTVHEKILLKIFRYGTFFREKNHLLVNFLPHSSFEPLTPKILGVPQKLTWCQQFGVQGLPKIRKPRFGQRKVSHFLMFFFTKTFFLAKSSTFALCMLTKAMILRVNLRYPLISKCIL